MSQESIVSIIIQQGCLPLYYNADENVSIEILNALYSGGVRAVEYTNRGDAAFANFKKMVEVKNSSMPGLLLGIGTIKNLPDAELYVAAGADFLISPGFVPEVAAFALKNKIFYAPGCMTPTEIIAAENAGVTFIKLFPGNMLGPEYMSTIKDVFPKLLFMPTGGVDTTRENLEGWFKSGVCAVGMGSKLISKKAMEQKDYEGIKKLTVEVIGLIQSVRGK